MNDGIENVLAFERGVPPKGLVNIHLELQGHGDDCSTVFEFLDKLITDILALFSFFLRGVLHLLILERLRLRFLGFVLVNFERIHFFLHVILPLK